MINENENGIEVKRWEKREDMEDMEGLAEKSGLRIPRSTGNRRTTLGAQVLLLFTPRLFDHIQSTKMAGHAMDIPQIIQSASINHNPDPVHDINPATAASEKQPVVVGPDSETNSIASDIVHPSRVIRPVHRRQNLPPLPDLRFEQSYLASIKDADTWGRVAWITTRDQVCIAAIHLIPLGCQE